LYTPELHDCRFPQLSTVPTAIRVVPIVSAEPTLSRLGVLANLPHRGSSSERFRFGADSESSAPCAIQMRCTPSRANPRYRSILCHDSTCRERQEVLEKTPKQSYRPQSDHDFSSGEPFRGGSYSASLGCNVRCPCALSARRLSDLHMSREAKSGTNHHLRTPRPTSIKARVPNQDCQIVPTPIMSQSLARWTTRHIVAANLPQRCNVLQYPEF